MDQAGSPLVSVIIPAYDVAEFIGDALNSVFAQTFSDFEVIVINDGSPDTAKLERVLGPYMSRIVYLKQENRGVSAARNTGIAAARGSLIAFLGGPHFSQVLFCYAFDRHMVAKTGVKVVSQCGAIE